MSLATLADEYNVEHYPSRAEKLADWWVHAIGLGGATVGGLVLLGIALAQGGPGRVAALSLYALGLIAMLACSAVYNLTHISPARPFLRRLDEAAIFVMIAGSYTPFTTQSLHGAWAVGMTTVVWLVALGGVAGKLLFKRLPEWLWTLVYIGFGWLAVIAARPFSHSMPASALVMVVIGGLLYTSGAVLFHMHHLRFRRAIWHGFVVVAAGVHYAAVLTGVVITGS